MIEGVESTCTTRLTQEHVINLTIRQLLNAPQCNATKMTLLHTAGQYASINTMELLVRNAADVNARDVNGRTPLHFAIKHVDSPKLLQRILIVLGAGPVKLDVNIKDVEGNTALHLAFMFARHSITRMLLFYGAQRGLLNDSGLVAEEYFPVAAQSRPLFTPHTPKSILGDYRKDSERNLRCNSALALIAVAWLPRIFAKYLCSHEKWSDWSFVKNHLENVAGSNAGSEDKELN